MKNNASRLFPEDEPLAASAPSARRTLGRATDPRASIFRRRSLRKTFGVDFMEVRIDDLRGPEIAALLTEHLECMSQVSPPESRHALNLEQLRQPGITFWTVWDGRQLAGCGALKEIDSTHGEVKSMRTARTHLRQGIASLLLQHIISDAKRRGYRRVSLETGSMAYFEAARSLYRKAGFKECAPFGGYKSDPNSNFFTREI